jgi:tocopherol O-methyltransferase
MEGCAHHDVAAGVASHYDQLDRFYRDIWGAHIHHGLWLSGRESYEEAQVNMVDFIASRAKLAPGLNVCDVGCGYGATACYLSERIKVKVTGLTISKAQYRHAVSMAIANPALQFIQGDWLANSFPDEDFNVVLALESTESMPDRPRFFSESARVLKNGGRLVVATWAVDPHLRSSHMRWLIQPLSAESRLQPLARPSEIAEMIGAVGLQLQHSEDISAQVARTWSNVASSFFSKAMRHPGYLRFLSGTNYRFIATVLRIWTAFRLGTLRYCVFTARKLPG